MASLYKHIANGSYNQSIPHFFPCQVARSGKAICHNFPPPIIYAILYSYMVCTVCMCVAMYTQVLAIVFSNRMMLILNYSAIQNDETF